MSAPRVDLCRGWAGVPGWLAECEAEALTAAVRSTPPGTAIVELGRWCGRSLVCLADARASQDLVCHSVQRQRRPLFSYDPYPEVGQAQEAGAKDMGITPHEAKSLAAGVVSALGIEDVYLRDVDAVNGAADFSEWSGRARLLLDGGPFKVGLLYVDDHHSGGRLLDELAAWEPLMADEAEVLIHDFYHEPYGLAAAVDRWMLDHPEWVMIETRLSMARLRRRWKAVPRKALGRPRIVDGGRNTILSGASGDGKPLVSVLYNTWRLGGLDCLKIGLDRQTAQHEAFEVVIVDALYPYRWRAVADLFKDAPYLVKHVNVSENPFPRDAGNRARNDAIRAARGDVCVWWCDYSIAEPESLERHWSHVVRSGMKASSCGTIVYGEIAEEALHPDFRATLPFRTIDDYADFVEALPQDSPLWISIFRDDPRALGRQGLIVTQRGHAQPYELRNKIEVSLREPIARDTRFDWLNGPIPVNLYYAKNEATAREVLLAVNGWEESFDDGHASDDLDICRRLNEAGSAFVLDKGNECFVPNPRPFFPLLRWKRTPKENLYLYETLSAIKRSRAIRGIVNELDQIPQPTEAAAPVPSC